MVRHLAILRRSFASGVLAIGCRLLARSNHSMMTIAANVQTSNPDYMTAIVDSARSRLLLTVVVDIVAPAMIHSRFLVLRAFSFWILRSV